MAEGDRNPHTSHFYPLCPFEHQILTPARSNYSAMQTTKTMQTTRRGMAARSPARASRSRATSVRIQATAASQDKNLGFETMRDGIKVASDETVLSPRFYTTDFDEMERMFSLEINPNLNLAELDAMLAEFKQDYNQKHFVRNETFKDAAQKIQGDARKIFIEFLERSCTAEFSGFLLYKELGRRLKTTSPAVAEIFTLMSRDEARHAGGFASWCPSHMSEPEAVAALRQCRDFHPDLPVYDIEISSINLWIAGLM